MPPTFFRGPPPGWIGPAPTKGSEIFVGKVPRDIFEDELVPVRSVVPAEAWFCPINFIALRRGFLLTTPIEESASPLWQ